MKKKKKTSLQKEKSLLKTERESFRFQMKWEAKKLYPEHTDELPARVEAECAIIEDANLLPDLRAGADFLQKFRMQFGDFAHLIYSSFLKNSIVAQCIGLTPNCAEGGNLRCLSSRRICYRNLCKSAFWWIYLPCPMRVNG